MRWIMITRKLDPADDRAGFVIRWVEKLAAKLDHLNVICQEHADPDLPDNVTLYSMGKESGVGRIGQARKLFNHLRHLTPIGGRGKQMPVPANAAREVDGLSVSTPGRSPWTQAPRAR